MLNVPSCLDKVVIPDGFAELLQELAVEVLKNQPEDVLDFCANYLSSQRDIRNNRIRLVNERKKAYLNQKMVVPDFDDKESIYSSDFKNIKRIFAMNSENVINECELFTNVDKKLMTNIFKKYQIKNVSVGEQFNFSAGNESPNIYIIQRGNLELYTENVADEKQVMRLSNHGYFGDFVLPHIAVAKTPSRVIVIKKSDLGNNVLDNIHIRREEYMNFINNMGLFKNLSYYDKRLIIDSMVEKRFESHQVIIKEGEEGNEMFLINYGFVSIHRGAREITSLGEGNYFGELSILNNQPRALSVTAFSTTKLFLISKDIVKSVIEPKCNEQLTEQINTYAAIEDNYEKKVCFDEESDLETPPYEDIDLPRKSVSAGRFNPELDDDDDESEGGPTEEFIKTADQRNRLLDCCRNILIFRCLDEDELEVVIDAMFQRIANPGDVIIHKGDDGDNFYVVDNGIYDIILPINGVDTVVAQYNNTGSFGELALMYNTPRSATVIAKTEGLLWAMSRDMFRKIVVKKAFKKRLMYEDLLSQVSIFSNVSSYERSNVADALRSRIYEPGQTIIRQGAEGLNMFFIEDGKAEIFVDYEDGMEPEMVGELGRGKYFGEMALINQKPRAATVKAKTKCRIAVLDRDSFERLLGPCIDVMKRNMQDYEVITQRKSTIHSKGFI